MRVILAVLGLLILTGGVLTLSTMFLRSLTDWSGWKSFWFSFFGVIVAIALGIILFVGSDS